MVATDVVDQVCAGTLARLDDEVERIDEVLGQPNPEERIRFAVLYDDLAGKVCSNGRSCAPQSEVVAIAAYWNQVEEAIAHELAHARVGMSAHGSVPLFYEGIAVALAPVICNRKIVLPAADELLAADASPHLSREEYHVGGELVAWLLETHGPELVLEFLGTLSRKEVTRKSSDPAFVRESYREHFGSEFDDDIHAHIRDPNELPPETLGCVAPELPRTADRLVSRPISRATRHGCSPTS